MTLMETKISHIPRGKLAAWIENLMEIVREVIKQEKLSGTEADSWVEVHFTTLQALAEDGTKQYTDWLRTKCSCGKPLLARDNPMYGVYLYHDHFTINCMCGKTHQFKFQLVEEPIEVPF